MGRGVEPDHRLSLELFKKAADLGDPEAHGQMGLRHSVGLARPENLQGSSILRFDEASVLSRETSGCQWRSGCGFIRRAAVFARQWAEGLPLRQATAGDFYSIITDHQRCEAVSKQPYQQPLA
jgi:TPR repeat protein